ncbi:hypothetical protein CHELA17_60341 [Chelatococcus asaccharovorans]|nr:hypothetical protein CHELA17_60341 [Chelatococcus asaccharovorans]
MQTKTRKPALAALRINDRTTRMRYPDQPFFIQTLKDGIERGPTAFAANNDLMAINYRRITAYPDRLSTTFLGLPR